MSLGVFLSLVFTFGWFCMFLFRAESLWVALPYYSGVERFWVAATPLVLTTYVTAACVTVAFSAVEPRSAFLSAALFGLALIFWFWGRAQIGEMRRPRLPDEPPLALRSDGVFGVVRHPLYFSYLVACAAPLLIVPRWFLCIGFGACVMAIVVRTIEEERRMHQQVGAAYAQYCKSVKRLVPWVW